MQISQWENVVCEFLFFIFYFLCYIYDDHLYRWWASCIKIRGPLDLFQSGLSDSGYTCSVLFSSISNEIVPSFYGLNRQERMKVIGIVILVPGKWRSLNEGKSCSHCSDWLLEPFLLPLPLLLLLLHPALVLPIVSINYLSLRILNFS